MAVSAQFTVNGNPAVAAHSVAYGSTVTLALVSITGMDSVEWRVESSSKRGQVLPVITPGGTPVGATATFVMPANPGDGLGRSFLVSATVRGAGGSQTSYVRRVVGALNGSGILPIAVGETTDRDATQGWIEEINQALSGLTPGSPGAQDLASVLGIGVDANGKSPTNFGPGTTATGIYQKQQVDALVRGVVITPTVGANQNDWNPTGHDGANVVRLNLTANADITGIVPPTSGPVVKRYENPSAFTATLKHQSGSSAAGNRLLSSVGADYSLAPNSAVTIFFDPTTARGRFTPSGSGSGSVTFAAVAAALAAANTPVDFNGQGLEGVAYVKPDPGQEFFILKGTSARFNTAGADTEIRPDTGGYVTIRDELNTVRLAANASGISLVGNKLQGGAAGTLTDDFVILSQLTGLLSSTTPQSVDTINTPGSSGTAARIDHTHALLESTLRTVWGSLAAAIVTPNSIPLQWRRTNPLQTFNVAVVDSGNSLIVGDSATTSTIVRGTFVQIAPAGVPRATFAATALTLLAPTLSWDASQSPTINQTGSATGSGNPMTMSAQGALASSNGDGGTLGIYGGQKDGTGKRGYVHLGQRGTAGAAEPFIGVYEPVASHRILVIGANHAIPNGTTHPTPGDGVICIKEIATASVGTPPSGFSYAFIDSTSHLWKTKDSGGTVH